MREALFLDRDGVINRTVKYGYGWDSPQKPQDVKLVCDIEKVIAWANKQKILVIEISNQPGVAKGKMSQKISDAIEKKVHQLLKEKDAFVDKAYICPHYPEAVIPELRKKCNCRKPQPGLLLRAVKELEVDPKKSIFVGDKASDAEAGRNAGCKTMIFIHNEDKISKVRGSKIVKADFIAISTEEILETLISFFKLK